MRLSISLRATGAMMVAAVAASLLAGPTAAGEPTTWYAGPMGTSVAGPGDPCTNPDFGSIQAAVDASGPRDTVLVCPGTYAESVLIAGTAHRGLTVRAVQQWKAIVRPTAVIAGYLAGFRVDDASHVRIIGMRIVAPTAAPCASVDFGIRLNTGARRAVIRANRIAATGSATLFGSCGLSHGISVADGASASILWNTVRNFRSTGVEVAGNGSRATIARNSIQFRHTDIGGFTVQGEGVNIVNDARAIVRDNRMVGIPSTAPAAGPAAPPAFSQLRYGVRTFGAGDGSGSLDGVLIEGNLIRYAYRGVKLTDSDEGRVDDNEIREVVDIGIRFVSSDRGRIGGNVVKSAGGAGISMEGISTDNLITSNDVAGNGGDDCRDETTGSGTAGTANQWAPDNTANDESPAGICLQS